MADEISLAVFLLAILNALVETAVASHEHLNSSVRLVKLREVR